MNEIKYEPLYGLQKPFDNGPADSTAYGLFRDGDEYIYYKIDKTSVYCFDTDNQWSHIDGAPTIPFLAMRRIIKTPVWTMADKLAGRLPEVGCKAVQIQGFCEVDVLMIHNGCVVVCNSEISDSRPAVFKIDSFMELFTPIETQAEKAKRLEDEWVEKAYDDLLAHIGIHSTESPDFVKQNLHRVYNALLSGELQAPKGE